MNNRPTVWVLKEQMRSGSSVGSSPMDYTPAYEYGDIRFITDFDLPLHPNSTIARHWYDMVRDFLKEFDPARDFLILTGQPLAMFMLGMIMGAVGVVPNILVWKREQGRYVLYTPTPIIYPVPVTDEGIVDRV